MDNSIAQAAQDGPVYNDARTATAPAKKQSNIATAGSRLDSCIAVLEKELYGLIDDINNVLSPIIPEQPGDPVNSDKMPESTISSYIHGEADRIVSLTDLVRHTHERVEL